MAHDHGSSPLSRPSHSVLRPPLCHKDLPALLGGHARDAHGLQQPIPIDGEVAAGKGPALEVNEDMASILCTIVLSEKLPSL